MDDKKREFLRGKERALRIVAEMLEFESLSPSTIAQLRELPPIELLVVTVALAKMNAFAFSASDRPTDDVVAEISGTADDIGFRLVTAGLNMEE